MAKAKTVFYCQNCGTRHAQWLGKCNACGEWNTIVEEVVEKNAPATPWKDDSIKTPVLFNIHDIPKTNEARITTKNGELDRVLGGGLVLGSVVLLGGEPGIGKSTLLLQVALSLNHLKVLYVSGEESATQIKLRAERIGIGTDSCFVLTETQTQKIFKQAKEIQPNVLIIDSIQTLQTQLVESSPGSVSQIRECTAELIRFAKQTNTPVILVGHITKEGNIAGPKILEHMVDVVLQFEGERNHIYRLLRAQKNRFGSTAELGIYEMQGVGLREVSNPSEVLISAKDQPLSGNAVASTMEGIRPMLIEIQALVSTAVYGTPQRSTTGYDIKRLNMLLAVLEKRAGFQLGVKDVFLNITGGIRVDDPAIDLAVVCAILSSYENETLPDNCCFAAEVGLSGEIRPVSRVEQRISEAEKLGYDVIFISKYNKVNTSNFNIRVEMLGNIGDLYKLLF
ncbi:DNA repair protein RadA [Ornithobacterium rhinotracheale]|uniref:DNA repair protein RadA n=1 Tax=Ornithobacterium rhinotracheale (strain ATCC 51463 / DSM 15997 / CCUG 23171 / CIP 104009 / LMG 9086) TaxID=867902 RepID=I4A1K5_ORNRL|nr:DNA repair protein RadA [Ornithobacterium rhinotracheale]AFL97839.1 DNA repair protein RadA [Ornithobacterium rhinotracheale DSM 15997]AIP99664.1 DNA repair protein RadA [Ornithobacterium rhinotracheale ORT-UMN 88]KGB65902.1 DNA repair protein RadA [Ornithobacterium rhinotracheale H06-030791]MCK0193864.1 DNA repair protein RadA [Ornithobacterium rhinotracheale]MCK0200217.1 DNA repair protein RadA [Ornithobacterium rhinotracheale]